VGKGIEIIRTPCPQSKDKIIFLFQVRHLWEHKFGEVDEEFVRKTGYDVKQI